MVDHLAEPIQRERTLINGEAPNGNSKRLSPAQFLARMVMDVKKGNNHDSPGRNALPHPGSEKLPETPNDGETGPMVVRRHHHQTNTNHEHLLLPHASSARHLSVIPVQQRLAHRSVNSSADNVRNHNEIDGEPLDEDDTHRRHTVHREHQPAVPARNHRLHHDGQPLRLIFMRHSERVNQVLGPDWFIKAFHTHTYQAYDANLPMVLPKRRFDRAYEFDAPLTG